VINPLGIIWSGGFLGVALFFVISGFIISHVAQTETLLSFAVKRAFRIFPPFWLAFGVAGVLAAPQNVTLARVVQEALLVTPNPHILEPSWTLTIEVIFYCSVAALLPLVKRAPLIAAAVIAIVPAIIVSVVKSSDSLIGPLGPYMLFIKFIPSFPIGMAIWSVWSKRAGVFAAAIVIVWAWLCLMHGLGPNADLTTDEGKAPLQLFLAVVLFLAVLWCRASIKPNLAWHGIADASYSIYLLHLPIGAFLYRSSLHPIAGFPLTMLCALLLTGAASYLSYRFCERPTQRLARYILSVVRPLPISAWGSHQIPSEVKSLHAVDATH
jgi:peptidoglycan/LPS O-acetylase OafA/YrhL